MTDTVFTIRRANPADAGGVLPLVQALAAHHGDVATASKASLIHDMDSVAVFFIACVDKAVVAYAALLPLAQIQFGARGWDIQNMYVSSAMREQGVGRALATACRDFARADGCQYLAVGTHPENASAQAAYRAWGFEQRPIAGPRFGLRL